MKRKYDNIIAFSSMLSLHHHCPSKFLFYCQPFHDASGQVIISKPTPDGNCTHNLGPVQKGLVITIDFCSQLHLNRI